MNTKRTKILLTVLLLLALGNYARMHGTEDIRTVEFLSIFAIGALAALLIREIFAKDNNED
ncbi:hypothetical protein G4D82_10710 [Flavobacterium sp. CYK-4]|uniref:hypothetical protein n=1 Tax=Flavobacterium lotistagni TaxID=2709660 RepID=UPI00140CBD1E|nr:hypothetical protein [Flavobacterium lotistagni]NHM07694.1 hypothetical protein [Flavobacterium lotistagni]